MAEQFIHDRLRAENLQRLQESDFGKALTSVRCGINGVDLHKPPRYDNAAGEYVRAGEGCCTYLLVAKPTYALQLRKVSIPLAEEKKICSARHVAESLLVNLNGWPEVQDVLIREFKLTTPGGKWKYLWEGSLLGWVLLAATNWRSVKHRQAVRELAEAEAAEQAALDAENNAETEEQRRELEAVRVAAGRAYEAKLDELTGTKRKRG